MPSIQQRLRTTLNTLAAERANEPKRVLPKDAVVYVAVDPGDTVIYVGQSISMAARWNAHRSKAAWWPEWSMIHIVRVTDIETARDYEKALIEEHQPFYNKLLNPARKQIVGAPRQFMLEPPYRKRLPHQEHSPSR